MVAEDNALLAKDNASEQRIQYEKCSKDLIIGETWFLIERNWWKNWQSFLGMNAGDEFVTDAQRPGNLENRKLLDEKNALRANLGEESFACEPESAWKLIQKWYSVDAAIPRKVIDAGHGVKQIEVYPLKLKVHLCNLAGREEKAMDLSPLSCRMTVRECCSQIAQVYHKQLLSATPCALWRLDGGQKKLIASVDAEFKKTLMEAELNTGDYVMLELQNSDGTWPRLTAKPIQPRSSQHQQQRQQPLQSAAFGHVYESMSFGFGSGTLGATPPSATTTSSSASSQPPLGVAGITNAVAKVTPSSTTSSPSRPSLSLGLSSTSNGSSGSYHSTLSGSYGSLEGQPGAVGLDNLGNTCFMNSALQCLAHVAPLTDYFLRGLHEHDVNMQNPLGTGGEVMQQYAKLMKQLFQAGPRCVAPRGLKATLGHHAPQFSGYSQQDSQELLAYLIDHIHEDVNLVKDKPYVEDVEGGDGKDDAEVAAEAWSRYRQRNRSIIVDLLQGQYKNTVVCPDCKHVSVKFDPFMYLTLPIPVLTDMIVPVLVVRRDGSIPVRYAVACHKAATMLTVAKRACEIAGLDFDAARMYSYNKGGEIFDLSSTFSITSLSADRSLCLYEVLRAPQVSALSMQPKQAILYHRLTKPNPMYRPDMAVTDPLERTVFGLSRILAYLPSHTNREVYAMARRQMRHYLPEELAAENGLKLYRVKSGGMECDTHRPAAFSFTQKKVCRGDLIEENDALFTAQFVAVDLPQETLDRPRFEERVDHESMQLLTQKRATTGLSLHDCFTAFNAAEKLSSDNTWYCPKCADHKEATKQLQLFKAPEFLIVHLKRFRNSGRFGTREKIDSPVDYPVQGLDIAPHVANHDPTVPLLYDLVSVSLHSGGLGGGHYTAVALNQCDQQWYSFNDSSVRRIDAMEAKSTSAYVLFYKRRATLSDEVTTGPSEAVSDATPMQDVTVTTESMSASGAAEPSAETAVAEAKEAGDIPMQE
eukprot:TRINITY_DN19_c0_g1_i1.p1 TRINITY_DN19_c0_g1~~TRINITY_DN19_c0_g1_i1.p1  ORF type:complete len:983 (+),score=196.58 TRINITY_DN19_c0_g1_i1:277-3225(+)